MSRTTKHKLKTVWVQDADLGAEVEVEISFTLLRGSPAQGPSYASGGQPADPDEIELVSAKADILQGDAYDDHRQLALDHWAEDWLQGDGFAEALEHAAEDDIADRDARDEARMEERRADR